MNTNLAGKSVLAVALVALWTINPLFAEKPSWAGEGKPKNGDHRDTGGERDEQRHSQSARDHGEHKEIRVVNGEYFGDSHRSAVRNYYHEQYVGGHCPPGLAKKHNGCMPPGQARKWAVGKPLPRDVVYYEVPRQLIMKVGPAPAGYGYVRVASDLLLIALGSRMVIDAIQDVGTL